MGQKQKSTADPTAEPKKKKRVGFSATDAGVEANDCIKIYLVSNKEEVGTSDGYCISPVDLNGFFDDDGKIYGYQGLKITIWISAVSFRAYADITFDGTSDGGKGITDLKPALQNIFGETLVETKDELLQNFSDESHFISSTVSNGEKLQCTAYKGDTDLKDGLESAASNVEVVRMKLGDPAAGHLYSRLIPLVLLLVDGSSPIDVTDPSWELYLLIQKNIDEQNTRNLLLGFSAMYRFYHYPDSSRLRLSQILVLPPYQHKGYGTYLVEVLSNVSKSENVYDFTVEEPMDYFQHVRTLVNIKSLLAFDPVQDAVKLAVSQLTRGKLSKKVQIPSFMPPPDVVENVRQSLKINKKQFLQCWEILIYLGLNPVDKYMDDFVTIVSNRVKADILGKDSDTGKEVIDVPSDHNEEMSFVMFRSGNGEASGAQMDKDQLKTQEEQIQLLVDERIKEIKLIQQKLTQHHA